MASTQRATQEEPRTAVCRPAGNGYALGILFGLVGLVFALLPLLASHPDGGIWAFAGGAAAFFWSIGGLAAAWDARSRVEADGDGLRWRKLGRWRELRWEQVRDFYLLPGNTPNPLRIIETDAGRLWLGVSGWRGLDELERLVAIYTPGVCPDGWQMLGGREKDREPLLFPFDTWDSRVPGAMGALGMVGGLVYTAYLVHQALTRWLPEMRALGGSWVVVSPLLLLGACLPLLLTLLGWVLARDWLRFRHCRIEVTPEAIEFYSPTGRVRIPWSEVVSYGYGRRGLLPTDREVRAHDGRIVTFVSGISRRPLLASLIEQRAVNAENREWPGSPSSEPLAASTFPTPEEAVCVFHYRTRMNRALLWLMGTYAFGAWTPLVAAGLGLRSLGMGDLLFTLTLVTVLGCLLGACIWSYYRSALVLDAQGVTAIGLRGRKQLAWADVQSYGTRRADVLTGGFVRGGGTEIRFWGGIARVDELQREIAARAPHAEGAWSSDGESVPAAPG